MAKKLEEKKTNKIIEVLKKEYPVEQILLAVLALMVIVLGAYIIGTNDNVVFNGLWFIDTVTEIKIFGWVIVALGAAAFIFAIWAYYVPSIGEMKKVSWPNRDTIVNNTARVFGFILFVALFFVLIEIGLNPLFTWIKGL